MSNYIRPRGTLDIVDIQAAIYQKVEETCKKVAKTYNYHWIQTPTFESTALFTRSSGEGSDIVKKEMYTFEDKGGRSLTLRPEGTAGVIRAAIENKLYATHDLPLKYFYLGSYFRYERPQAGRYREFSQFGVEVIGTNSYLDDVETILFVCQVLKELKIEKYKVKINSFGNDTSRSAYRDLLKEFFTQYQDVLCEDCKNRLQVNPLRILDCKIDHDFFSTKQIPTAIDSLDENAKAEFEKVQMILKNQNVPFIVDHHLVRGLDYYTGLIFEFDIQTSDGKVYTIGGGGHYSNLVKELGGPDLACVGFGLGMNRIALVLEDLYGQEAFNDKADIYIMPLSEKAVLKGIEIASLLRNENYRVIMENAKKSVSSMFKFASKNGIHYAIVIGDDELDKQMVNIKDLTTQQQEQVAFDKINEFFRRG